MIKILGKDWNLVFARDNAFTAENMGMCEPKYNTITIIDCLSKDNQNEVILHEVLHAIDDALHLNLGEQRVTALSSVLFSVLKENGIKVDFKQHK